MSIRVYQRIAPRTGISMPWWAAPFVYSVWITVWLAFAALCLLAALVVWLVRLAAEHRARA